MEKRKLIQLCIVNESDEIKNAVILGCRKFMSCDNFGSDLGITITTSQSDLSYAQVLQESLDNPFKTDLFRIQTNKHNQLENDIRINYSEDESKGSWTYINVKEYLPKFGQQGIVDIQYKLDVNGNTYLTYPILPKTTVVLTLFHEGYQYSIQN